MQEMEPARSTAPLQTGFHELLGPPLGRHHVDASRGQVAGRRLSAGRVSSSSGDPWKATSIQQICQLSIRLLAHRGAVDRPSSAVEASGSLGERSPLTRILG
jgi:hypothetical protein